MGYLHLRCNALAVLLAYAAFSILLIFLNKTVLSKLRQSSESHLQLQSPHSVSVSQDSTADKQSTANVNGNAAVFIDFDVFRLTFMQCAFTACALHLILRCSAGRCGTAQMRFGMFEFIASNLFVAMLITSNLCLKLIPVSVLPVSRSLTFVFVLTLDRLASKLNLYGAGSKPPSSLFTGRRCIVYGFILFGYIGAMEKRPEQAPSGSSNDASLLLGLGCGMVNSLISALTSLAMKATLRKRSIEAEANGRAAESGTAASVSLCFAMNLYAASLGVSLFIGYQTVVLLWNVPTVSASLIATDSHVLTSAVSWLSSPWSMQSWISDVLANANWSLVAVFGAASLTTVIVSALNLMQLELCSPVTVQISNATKSVALTLIAVAYYREQHALIWYAANLSMLAGSLLYATESRPSQSSPPPLPVSPSSAILSTMSSSSSGFAKYDEVNNELEPLNEDDLEEPIWFAHSIDTVIENESAEMEEWSALDVANMKIEQSEISGSVDTADDRSPLRMRRKSSVNASFQHTRQSTENRGSKQMVPRRARQRSWSRFNAQYPHNGALKNLHLIKKRP